MLLHIQSEFLRCMISSKVGQHHKKESPAVLEAEAGSPGLVGQVSAKSGGGEPIFIGEGEETDHGEHRSGKEVEGKDVAAGKELQRIDEKDQGADLEQPEGAKGEAEGEAELKQGGAEQRGETMDKVQVGPLQIHRPGKKE